MKKTRLTGLMLIIAVITIIISPPSVNAQSRRERRNAAETPAATPAPTLPSQPANPFFNGDGGKGMSLAVLVPTGSGLTEEQNYLTTLVQGVLVGDLSKYSAISVLDRLKLETVLKETESGIYRDEAAYGRLGEIAEVDYALTGSVTKTSTGYAMQIQVVGTGKNNIGVIKASYSGNATIREFDNFTGIRKASLDLLTQMGVNLTDAAKRELSGAASTQTVNAQTTLSQGITAQRQGNEWQAIINYWDARTFDASIPEASTRIISASTTLSANNWNNTGGARATVMNEIERQREATRLEAERVANIKALLEKASAFYQAHQPFVIGIDTDVFYYGNIKADGAKGGTVDIGGFDVSISTIQSEIKIIRDLEELAVSIGMQDWPFYKYEIYALQTIDPDSPRDVRRRIQRENAEKQKDADKRNAGKIGVFPVVQYINYNREHRIVPFEIEYSITNDKGKEVLRKTVTGHSFDNENFGGDFFPINSINYSKRELYFMGSKFLEDNKAEGITLRDLTSYEIGGGRYQRLRERAFQGRPIPTAIITNNVDWRNGNPSVFMSAYWTFHDKVTVRQTIDRSNTINADDFTDNMTMRIISINGKKIDSGFVGIERSTVILSARRR